MADIDAEELADALNLVRSCLYDGDNETDTKALDAVCAAAEAHLARLRAPKGELEEARAELTRETIAAALKEGFDFWVDNESDGRNAFEMYADVVLRLIAGLKSNEAEWRDLAVGLSESLTANAPFTLGPQRDQHRKLAERVWAELPGNRDGDLTVLKAAFLLVAQAALSRVRGEGTTDALRTAAREAQVRVLRLALEKHLPDGPAYLAVLSLKERLESGEDL